MRISHRSKLVDREISAASHFDGRYLVTAGCCLAACLLAVARMAISAEPTTPDAPNANGVRNGGTVSEPLDRVWLSDLHEQNVRVGAGLFGKQGRLGSAPGFIYVQGIACHHGLGMQPDAHVEYSLGKKYHRFHCSVALDDWGADENRSPIIFQVLGDGKLLWKSIPLTESHWQQPCLLDITGIDLLTIEVRYLSTTPRGGDRARGVWDDPYVSSEQVSPPELALYRPEQFEHTLEAHQLLVKCAAFFDEEKFDDLETLTSKWRHDNAIYGGNPILSLFYEQTGIPTNKTSDGWRLHFARLERWQRAKPSSVTPEILLAIAHLGYGWQFRGENVASEVPPAAWAQFTDSLEKSKAELTEAEKLGADPEIYRRLIDLNRSQGDTVEAALAVLDKGKKLAPRYYPIYTALAMRLLPRWGAGPGELAKIADQLRTELGGDLGEKVYFQMALTAFLAEGEPFITNTRIAYPKLLPGMQAALRDDPEDNMYVNAACHLACIYGDEKLARMLVERVDPTSFSPVAWSGFGLFDYYRLQFEPGLAPQGRIRALKPLGGWTGSIAFLGDQGRLLVSGKRAALSIWDASSGTPVDQIPVPQYVTGLAADSRGRNVVARWTARLPGTGLDQLAAVFRYGSNDPAVKLAGHTAPVSRVAISRDGERCGTASADKTAMIWNLADPSKPLTLKHPTEVVDITFAPDGKTVATSDAHGAIRIWKCETGEQIGAPLSETGKEFEKSRIRFLADGQHLISAHDATIRRWSLEQRTFQDTTLEGEIVTFFEVSPDGKWLAVGRANGALDLVAIDGWKVVRTYLGHYQSIFGIAFDPKGSIVASSSMDGIVNLWPIPK